MPSAPQPDFQPTLTPAPLAAPARCAACHGGQLNVAASWADWEASCARRPDGAMRMAATMVSGVAKDRPDLLACDDCGTISLSQMPTDAQLERFYTHYHATDEYEAKAWKKVWRAYKRILPFRMIGVSGRFLEVGSSIGTASEAARRLGFQVTAQDIDRYAIQVGSRLFPEVTFHHGPLADLSPDAPFDMIYCAEVIEHVLDPWAFASEMFDRLKPGGWIFMTTPDASHPKRPQTLLDWSSVKPPEHLTLFTKTGLDRVMAEAGFLHRTFLPYAKPGIRFMARRPKG